MSLQVNVVVNNVTQDGSFLAEHGLSLLLRGSWGDYLLDTGAGKALLHNLSVLGIHPASIRSAVLSHGHYDHSGGLLALAMAGRGAQQAGPGETAQPARSGLTLHCHREAFRPRFVEYPGKPLRCVGPACSEVQLQELGVRLIQVQGPMRLAEGLVLSGPVGGPKWGSESFVVRQGEELVEDMFSDEIFMLARGRAGWALISGCCHRGLVNTLRLTRFLTRGEPLAAIIGGLHLRRASAGELKATAELLEKEGAPALYAGHCTGDDALRFLSDNYSGPVSNIRVGDTLNL